MQHNSPVLAFKNNHAGPSHFVNWVLFHSENIWIDRRIDRRADQARHGTPRTPDDVRKHRCVRHIGLNPRNEWHFKVGRRSVVVPIDCVMTCNEIDSSIAACVNGLGMGMFLSYQVAPRRKSGKLEYVLEAFETEPLPVQIVYPHSKLLSTKVRAFADACIKGMRQVRFD